MYENSNNENFPNYGGKQICKVQHITQLTHAIYIGIPGSQYTFTRLHAVVDISKKHNNIKSNVKSQ